MIPINGNITLLILRENTSTSRYQYLTNTSIEVKVRVITKYIREGQAPSPLNSNKANVFFHTFNVMFIYYCNLLLLSAIYAF